MSRLMTKPKNDCAPSEDSDQSGHPPSLISVFAVRMKKALVLSYPLSAQRKLYQTGRTLRLIWVFAGRTLILLVLSWCGSSMCHKILFRLFRVSNIVGLELPFHASTRNFLLTLFDTGVLRHTRPCVIRFMTKHKNSSLFIVKHTIFNSEVGVILYYQLR